MILTAANGIGAGFTYIQLVPAQLTWMQQITYSRQIMCYLDGSGKLGGVGASVHLRV